MSAPALGIEIIRTRFHGVYNLVVEVDNKKRKQIKRRILEHNIAMSSRKEGGVIRYNSHSMYNTVTQGPKLGN